MNTDPDPQPWSCSAAKFLVKYLFFGQVAKDILAGLHQAEAEILPYDEQVKVRQHEKSGLKLNFFADIGSPYFFGLNEEKNS